MTRGSFCNCTLSSRNLSSHEPCDDCRPAKKRRTGTNDTRNNSWDPGTEDAVSCFVETAEEHMWDEGGLTNSLPVVKHQPPETSEFSVEDEKVGLVRKLYSSSLYTDAFDLTLDTVLAKESHLFSKTEAEILQKYRSLPYEARYLYVRLFLRKSATWFRINKLEYHAHITDIQIACSMLWSPETGFAESQDAIDTLLDAAALLTLEELRLIGKDEKFPRCTSKAQFINALRKAATGQGRLQGKDGLSVKFDLKGGQYMKKIFDLTGPCIRLHPHTVTIFNRVHLVFYRSTQYSESSLRTLILARTLKRNFPTYVVSRTSNIFSSRDVLIEFEESLKLQAEVDTILEGNCASTKASLHRVLDIAESVYSRWLGFIEEERCKVKSVMGTYFDPESSSGGSDNEVLVERIYLRRFSPGWVFTRIIHKGLYSLARLKMYLREHEILTQLLSQRFFHTARRGAWYQRKALIEEHYLASILVDSDKSETATKRKWLMAALDTCCKGLQDPLTHVSFHYDLQKRIMKLEQKLKVPKRDQHDFHYAMLLKPTERIVYGVQIQLDKNSVQGVSSVGTKTVWLDPDPAAKSARCSVEEMCLSYYRSLGWKGYHCEGSLLRTLFAYLFYDIIFLYIPNVFETEYQTCPLDLFTEAFYPTRISEVNHRLVDIENGGAKRLIREIWEKESNREPCAVGLDWKYKLEDLEEIAECLPGGALAAMCKVLCQEYQQRSAGLPDLFLWDNERKDCMFAEVKSENDKLSDTQRLWIHVLSSAGVKVELCHAVAKKAVDVKGEKEMSE